MGYIKEPKNIDLVVSPSVFTEDTKNQITRAIAQYKKTGLKPVSIEIIAKGSIKANTGHAKEKTASPKRVAKKYVK